MTFQLPVTATAIRAWRALGRPPTPHWVAWAVEQLKAGRDGPNLRVLAGLNEPFDYFDTIRFVDGALAELGIPSLAPADAIAAYSQELIAALAEQPAVSPEVLSELAGLCVDTDYPKALMPFYLLHFARQDLLAGEEQHYWNGADSSNIDAIVVAEARKWLAERAA